MPSPDLVIGLDCSTTACKAIIADTCGNVLAMGRAMMPMVTPRSSWHEQPADSWWEASCQALREAAVQVEPARLAALCIAAQRETFVITDGDGHPLVNAPDLTAVQGTHS